MCLIMCSFAGKEISKDHLETSFLGNPHGSGIAGAKDGKILTEKGFFKFEEFYEVYKKYIGMPHIIHHRWKTHGETDKDNCHPFIISEKTDEKNNSFPTLVLFHNGVIHGYNTNPKMSDTFNFCEDRLKPLTIDTNGVKWWKNTGFKWLIESVIGNGNKFSLLDSDGEITIFNQGLGEWADEEETIWASNNSYKVLKARNDPRVAGNHFLRYESDSGYYGRPTQQPHNSTLFLEDKTKKSLLKETIIPEKNKNDINLFDISDEELREVDDYLQTLNATDIS